MTKKILHIAGCDKFVPPFIRIIKEHFNFEEHEFFLTAGPASEELINAKNVCLSKTTLSASVKHYFHVYVQMHKAEKIFLHGLFDIRLVLILFFAPWLLKRCYWVIWGGDLYTFQLGRKDWKWKIKEFFRQPVIKNVGYLVTYIKGDVELARRWYEAKGQYLECFMYPSNLYKDFKTPKNRCNTINIQVGNSADSSNNHLEVLKKLLPYRDKDICIHLPLSYGSEEYAMQVVKQGKKWFGEKLNPLTVMLPFLEYVSFLGTIDIAIFNHKRQQAMGNVITLLGLGKTVYIRSDTTQWQFFMNKGIVIKDVKEFNSLERFSLDENTNKIKEYFSKDNYLKQLEDLFNQ